MSPRITVAALDGRAVPLEGVPGCIGAEPCDVNDSHYYRSRISAGELRVIEAKAPTESTRGTQAGDAESTSTSTRRHAR